ncbi:MAG: NAD kinase [Acholeplasmataceae bacterium]|nr:NAD kinase [Acholeplasmataceae bacterium]
MKYTIYGNYQHDNFPFIRDDKDPDIVFSFGGDGTMLEAIHKYENILHKVKFIGVNTGRLGFFNDYTIEELPEIFQNLSSKEYDEDHYRLLEYRLESEKRSFSGYAVNELALTNPISTQIIDVFINSKHFETFRGTGILVSPPTGSTAYNKSLGGSVVDPHIEAVQLTEIAPLNNRIYKVLNSPLILSARTKIKLSIKESDNIYISVDGKHLEFTDLRTVFVGLSEKFICFILKKNTDFFDRVKRAFIDN